MNGMAEIGITKREGIFDTNNGLFLELNNSVAYFVKRSYTSGSAVDTRVSQSSWAIDSMDGTGSSGIKIDWSKTQIMIIDYEWLGVGRARMGFVIDGMIYYAHEFLNTNVSEVVYMSTPNLPLRSEIINDSYGVDDSITQICSTVISEGGSQDLGIIRYASTSGNHIDIDGENTLYSIMGIRPKTEYIGATIKILNASLQIQSASHKIEWKLVLNPTTTTALSYSNQTNSAVQIAVSGSNNTTVGGIDITGGWLESAGNSSGGAGSLDRGIENALAMGSKLDGTVDEIILCARPVGGSTSVNVEASLSWRELV